MGFWHTGYIDLFDSSQPLGSPTVRTKFEPQPKRFPCAQCDELYSSPDELLTHRFEAHPLHRPVMFVRGRELGTNRERITQSLSASDVRIDRCDRVIFNGGEISIPCLPDKLAAISSDVCRIVLSKDGVDAAFELDFQIASEKDIEGVEDQFERIVRGGKLDIRAIENLITATSGFTTAIGYCDGICAYLYGVLAKERSGGSTLPYEAYEGKFSKAVEELATYGRPLTRTIGSLIEFHFNHFRDSTRLSPESCAGRVSARYSDWIELSGGSSQYKTGTNELEVLVTDWETEQILRWASRPLNDLAREAAAIENFLKHVSADYDKAKLHILLGELYTQMGNIDQALMHAKALRNVQPLHRWAEALIKTLRGE